MARRRRPASHLLAVMVGKELSMSVVRSWESFNIKDRVTNAINDKIE